MEALQTSIRDDFAPPIADNPHVRKGRFLWMEAEARAKYISDLKNRIGAGYYFTDQIVDKIVEEIATVVNDAVDRELQLRY